MDISARARQIWAPFYHQTPPPPEDVVVTHSRLMGIFAHCYEAGRQYLMDLTDWELTMLAAMHEQNMARLGAEEEALLFDIGARVYVKRLQIQIKDDRLPIREAKLNAEKEEVQARIDALEADRAALEVLHARIERARAEAEAQIEEIKAKIQMEGVERAEIAIKELELELQKAETELQTTEAGLLALEYQLGVTQAAIDLLKEDVNQAQTQARNAGLEADIAGKELIHTERAIAEANLDADEAQLEADQSRQQSAEARDQADAKQLEAQQFRQTVLFPIELSMAQDNLDEMKAKLQRALANVHQIQNEGSAQSSLDQANTEDALSRIIQQIDDAEHQTDLREISDDAKLRLSQRLRDIRQALAARKLTVEDTRQGESTFNADHVIAVAELLATANISNQLMHRIGTV